MEWISLNDKLPPYVDEDKDISIHVLVTDGHVIEIGRWIYRPRSYGCAIREEGSEYICSSTPHWHIEDFGPFKDGSICFGRMEGLDITHWMELPKLPEGK